MDVNYGAAVKQYLTTRVQLLHLHRFCPPDVQFDDALVSSALVIFEKTKPAGHEVVFSLGRSLIQPGQSVLRWHGSLRASDKWTQYTAASGPGTRGTGQDIRFGDLFTMRTQRRDLIRTLSDFSYRAI
jgi:adenine-specific DNA-methyltransferase